MTYLDMSQKLDEIVKQKNLQALPKPLQSDFRVN